MRVTNNSLIAAVAVLCMTMVGCASISDLKAGKKFGLADRMPWANKPKEDEQPYPNPVKLAATWTPDTLVQTGRTPTRGFGGRLFFYNEKSQPVPVEGSLVVHGFDETAAKSGDNIKRFEFTPEQFTTHFSKSDLGASYSIWIPWDAVGGERKRISLVASFKTTEGKLVQGIPATVMLPGSEPTTNEEDLLAKFSPQYREYKNALTSHDRKPSGLVTTTIKRRKFEPAKAAPGVTLPRSAAPSGNSVQSSAIVSNQGPTPSVEIDLLSRPKSPAVMPASAQGNGNGRLRQAAGMVDRR